MNTARDLILRRIRGAGARTPSRPSSDTSRRPSRTRTPAKPMDLFVERVVAYRAHVDIADSSEVGGVVEQICAARGVRSLAVPDGLPGAWLPRGIELVHEDASLDHDALEVVGGALTTCVAAAAETGTIALDHGPSQGRRALTLLPDLHVCVVAESQILRDIPQLIDRLGASVAAGRPVTLISGPSATSDIELQRVEGVHGPRVLAVVVVTGGLIGSER